MAWYRTGTVTTTASVTVVGAGTAWVASVVAGDLFTVDAQKFYEVSAVNNDGSITLQTAYVGTVGAGQSYAIIRTSDSTATLALSLSSMISAWHLTLDQLLNWLTSTTNTTLTNPATGISTTVITPAQLTASAVGSVSKTVTTADVTLTTAESANGFITVSGALTGNRNLVFPATQSTMCAFTNNCTGAYTLTVKTASGSGVVIAAGERALVYCDGTNVVNAFTATPGINALDVANTPAGNIASTTVQAALNELDTEKASLAQATSAVAITGGSINSTPIGATTPSTISGTTGTFSGVNASLSSVGSGTASVYATRTGGANTILYSDIVSGFVGTITAHPLYLAYNNTNIATISSTGLAVTGNISSTSDASIHGVTVGLGSGSVVSNTAVGSYSLLTNTTGFQNTASGVSAMYSNTTGYQNTASGVSAMYSNTTGYQNTASGESALYSNTTGYYNAASGLQAGYGTAGVNANTTGSNNTFLGSKTVGATSADTNEIVIGANAIGLGSNTTVIGSASTTMSNIKGRVLVGTTTDDGVNALQVNGAVKSSGNVLGAIGTVQFIAQSAVTPHSSSNAGSITFGISDGGGNIASGVSSGVRVNNIWSSPYSSQSIDFLTSHGGTSISTVRANIGIDGLFSIYNGLAVTGNISATGTIAPQQATTAGAPAYVKGAIYFDTTLNKLRIGGATAWETITSI